MNKLNRIAPLMPTRNYTTYQITAPLETHWRKATCAEVECPQYLNGWRVRVEGLPADMVHAAKTSGRKYTELHVSKTENWLVFEAGQSCFRFSQHRAPLDRQENFIVRGGDWRGNPTGSLRKHTRPEFWVEDFSENQDKIAQQIQQG